MPPMLPAEPRHFMPSRGLLGAGLPHDRMARVAARQAFVVLKATFMHAVEDIEGETGEWLRRQVRAAEEPTDLWLLRAPVFAALAGVGADHGSRSRSLRRGLQTLFPDSGPVSEFASF